MRHARIELKGLGDWSNPLDHLSWLDATCVSSPSRILLDTEILRLSPGRLATQNFWQNRGCRAGCAAWMATAPCWLLCSLEEWPLMAWCWKSIGFPALCNSWTQINVPSQSKSWQISEKKESSTSARTGSLLFVDLLTLLFQDVSCGLSDSRYQPQSGVLHVVVANRQQHWGTVINPCGCI